MTDQDEFLKDDFLRDLIRQSPLDSPSDDFVDRVMANIQVAPEISEVNRPFYLYLKAAIPYAAIAFVLIFVLATSDLPIFNWLPGKDYFVSNMTSYFGSLFTILKNAFASKYVSWVVLISFSAGVLFFIDRLFSRRTSM